MVPRRQRKCCPTLVISAGKFKTPIELLAVIDIAEMAAHLSAEKARFLDTMVEDGVKHSTAYLRDIASTFPGGGCEMQRRKGPCGGSDR